MSVIPIFTISQPVHLRWVQPDTMVGYEYDINNIGQIAEGQRIMEILSEYIYSCERLLVTSDKEFG